MMNVMFRRLAAAAFAGAVLAGCTQESDAAQRTFVLWDPGLQLPAVCYRLDDGWQGKGAIAWNMRSDNKFMTSTILSSPSKHMLVQTSEPMMTVHEGLTPQRLAEFQNPEVLANDIAMELNQGIVEPGLTSFVATSGQFTQDVPQITRLIAAAATCGTTLTQANAFGFVATFRCTYGGVECEARYTTSYAVAISSVPNPRVPKICNWTRVAPVLAIAPVGKMSEALHDAGRMFASAFVNYAWAQQRDRTLAALFEGTRQGREAGWKLWWESAAGTSAMLDRIREERSKQIREVRTVDNPFEPGTKIERPAFFKNSWINSRQDAILLSDSSLEPNIVRGLMEQGEWLPAN